MKRYRIHSPFRFTVFASIVILATIFCIGSIFGLFDAASMDEVRYATYTVRNGDTLWAIAKEYGSPDVDCRQTIYEICKANQITAETLYAGITILIPQQNEAMEEKVRL